MKLFFFVIGFIIVFFTIVILVLLNYLRRGVKKFTQSVTGDYEDDDEFRRMANKHYKEKNGAAKFDKDYFKSSNSAGTRSSVGKQQANSNEQAQSTKKATTKEGVTIIDGRDQSSGTQRKIFTDDEGEYVDFEEA